MKIEWNSPNGTIVLTTKEQRRVCCASPQSWTIDMFTTFGIRQLPTHVLQFPKFGGLWIYCSSTQTDFVFQALDFDYFKNGKVWLDQ